MPDRKNILVAAGLVAALGVGFGAAQLLNRNNAATPTEEAKEEHTEGEASFVRLTSAQAAAAGVSVVTAATGGANDLRLTGRVEASPSARAAVAAPVAGAVERVAVAPGASVAAGTVLALIRSGEGAAARAETIAAAAEAEAARTALVREERLLNAGVVARQDWEAARATSARATAEAAAARAKLAAMGSPTASGQTAVRSPISGVVTALQVAPGGFVAQGGLVAEISDPTQIEVVFSAPAEAAARLRVGSALKIIGPDGGEADAVIVGIAPLAQNTTGAATVRARPLGGRLPPGAAVSAVVATDIGGLPTVPAEAVQTLGGRPVVFIAEAEGFRARPVTPGRSGGGTTQIVAGLQAGERVVGRGAFILKAELSKGEAEHEE